MSSARDLLIKPVRGLLALDHAEVAYTRDLKNDYAVIPVDGAIGDKDFYDPSWGPRCFNDPEGLKRPTKIDGSL